LPTAPQSELEEQRASAAARVFGAALGAIGFVRLDEPLAFVVVRGAVARVDEHHARSARLAELLGEGERDERRQIDAEPAGRRGRERDEREDQRQKSP
jgi:hypothetical protein